MNIKFTGIHAPNENFGINFQAKVDGQSISCVVSTDALEDINPNGRMDGAAQQYSDNQSQLESIARQKIQKGEIENGRILINQADVL
jgi:hypothetical protein